MPTVPDTVDPNTDTTSVLQPPPSRPARGAWADLIEKHFNRVGLDPAWGRRIMQVESSGNPDNITGSYKGLFQLSNQEFKANGGTGNILDPEQNIMAAANKLSGEKLRFEQAQGRPATLKDLYLIHNQGEGGYKAHLEHPDRPAWQNMLSTAEGKQKGEKWAKAAIWGNLSDAQKAKYGSVDAVTGKDFIDDWGNKMSTTETAYVQHGPFKVAQKRDIGPDTIDQAHSRGLMLDDKLTPDKPDPEQDLGPGFAIPKVVSPDVQSPDISVGSGPVTAPTLAKAGRYPT